MPNEQFSIKPDTAKYMSSSLNSLESLTRLAMPCRTIAWLIKIVYNGDKIAYYTVIDVQLNIKRSLWMSWVVP